MSFGWLSVIIFLPLAVAMAIALIPRLSAKNIKLVATCATLATLAITVIVFTMFDRTSSQMQFVEMHSWIPAISANYHLGVDGISLPLVVLTALMGFVAVLVSWRINTRVKEYFAWLLVLEASILGVFCSLDLLLFFVFWEIEVIPIYFLISIWGSGNQRKSAMKYVLFTLAGSALMLAGIICIYSSTGSLDMVSLMQNNSLGLQTLLPVTPIFFLLLAGFAVKLPMVPLHGWQPDTYTNAPTAVSTMLAGALAKMGGYGIIRLCVSLFPSTARDFAPLMLSLAVISIIYGGIMAIRQTNIKRLIAYSSVSHMGFVLLGVFALSSTSTTGAVMQMVSHGLITALLFATAAIVVENTGESEIAKLGGLARKMPVTATLFILGGLAALGLPSTSGFAAEFTILVGSFGSTTVSSAKWFTAVALLGVLLAAVYILWTVQRVFYGPVIATYDNVKDANNLQKGYCLLLVVLIFAIGICPTIITSTIAGH